MNKELTEKCQLLADNYHVVKKSAKLDMVEANTLGALVFTAQNQQASESEIRAMRAILKDNVGFFNNLRGATNISVLSKMSMADNPEDYLDRVMAAYQEITEGKVIKSPSLANAAMALVDFVDPSEYAAVVKQARFALDKMRSKHPLLTDSDDLTVAIMLAISGLDMDAVFEEADRCYDILKDEGFFLNKDSLQSVSLILALNNAPAEAKCARFKEIRSALKSAGSKIAGTSLPIIAALVGADVSIDQMIEDINEADAFLKHQKGFHGAFGCGPQLRRVYASSLALQTYKQQNFAVAETNALTTIIVEQVIMLIITVVILVSINVAIQSSIH